MEDLKGGLSSGTGGNPHSLSGNDSARTLVGSTRWEVLACDDASVERLVRELKVTPLVARVLVARGIVDPAQAARFLKPSLERDWLDPLLIPGLSAAADRVQGALESGERICVFGDFDVDGISATCLLAEGLRALGGQVGTLIPRRFGEGYGLSVEACNRAKQEFDPQLVVTVDNGIAAAQEVAWMLEHGMDVVITDHHEPADLVPRAVPVCDPRLEPDNPCRELAGVGVALKLVAELGRRMGKPDLWRSLTDLCALGTVSDMMQLTGENRSLVHDGIQRLRVSARPGIVALAASAGIDLSTITSDGLPFSIVPRLNASGRMGCADLALDLLMCSDPVQAAELASQLEDVNRERRDIEGELSREALAQAEELWHEGARCLVLAGVGWHEGVKGIVASRVVNRYHVPTILFSISEDGTVARGSGRSVGSVDLFHAVEQCSDLVLRFGGHAGAVGVSIDPAQLGAFRARMDEVLHACPADEFEDSGEVACFVGLEELTVPLIRSLDVLQPFGQGNKVPLFAARNVTMVARGRVGAAGDHLRFFASDGISSVPAIMFRAPQIERAASCDEAVDLVFEAVAEEWQGRVKPKLMVRDIIYRPAVAPSLQSAAASPAPEPAWRPEELAGLSYDELTQRLVRLFIGDHELLDAQRRALDTLAQGRSCMAVMATGRGKSLIFHVHAAREAIARGRASVFVYPLRALVADQRHHLSDVLAELGLQVRELTGETSAQERAEVYAALADGSVSVVLTTPEYLAIHVDDFAAAGRVGFVVVDESHHAARAAAGERPAYLSLPALREKLGDPTVLAVTATAGNEAARSVCELTGVADERDVIVDESERPNLQLRDARMASDREAVLVSLVARGEKCVVYVNSRPEAERLVALLRRRVPDLARGISYYHAELTRERRQRVERAFRGGRLTCIVSTSAFGEGVNLPDVRHVVLYHLPFGRVSFNQMAGRAGRDGAQAWVHLLYNGGDAQLNERLLAASAPTREALSPLWRVLSACCRASADASIPLSCEQLAERVSSLDPRCSANEALVEAGVGIFCELGLVRVEGFGDQRRVAVVSRGRVDLSDSVRFQEGLREHEDFEAFAAWALSADPEELRAAVIRPITPAFGSRA